MNRYNNLSYMLLRIRKNVLNVRRFVANNTVDSGKTKDHRFSPTRPSHMEGPLVRKGDRRAARGKNVEAKQSTKQ